MSISWIRSWDSTNRFAGSLAPRNIRPFRELPKIVFNRQRFSFQHFLHYPLYESYERVFTHIHIQYPGILIQQRDVSTMFNV